MLPEALVIFACLNSTGCSETSAHYFNTHPEARKVIKNGEEKIKYYVGPTLITTVGPFIYAAAGGTGTVRLNRYFSLQISKNQNTISYRLEF